MHDEEPKKDEAEELLTIIFDDAEFDEWAAMGMIPSTDQLHNSGPDTEDDLPAISIS